MANTSGQGPLIIERILRDRDGIWQQIAAERDLRTLVRQLLVSSVVSLALYGAVLGASNSALQALSSVVKLPLLFLATLAICLPTLYLFNLVFGARLSMMQAVSLIMVSITVTAVLTLAFAPISLFFLITAQSYAFFKLLNVGILVLTAVVGLRFLTAGMAALNARQEAAAQATAPVAAPPATVPAAVPVGALVAPVGNGTATAAPQPVPQPVPVRPGAGQRSPVPAPAGARASSMGLLYIWILLFGFVGTQLAWTLRPFFGSPGEPFSLFRHISGTFYADVIHTIGRLLGAG